jgi:probable phosphoglycerate mutase
MSLTLYLLRHGETTYSRTGGYCGNLDPELTDEGSMMAEQFAAAYETVNWAAVYVSPMRRTLATARPLCDALGMTPHLRDGLKEIAYGEWEGKTAEYVSEHFHEDYVNWLTEPAWNAPTGGETGSQVANRAVGVLTEILGSHRAGSVLLVSHKATIRVLLCSLLGIDLGRYRDRLACPAASVSVVKFLEHGPLLEQLGDRSYMTDELRAMPGT